jgi:DNA oxidative demethylase
MSGIAAQSDLLAEPGPAGLSLAEAIVSPEEEAALIAAIDASELSPFRFHGWLGKRLTQSYGWRYDFDDGSFTPGEPIPDWLKPVRAKAARLAGLDRDDLAQALLVRYDPGAGIGWHRDRPVFEHVVGISLGHAATMRFRRRRDGGFERISVQLAPRAAYHLTGEARWEWEHSIPPVAAPRWSITFRSRSQKGRRSGAGG